MDAPGSSSHFSDESRSANSVHTKKVSEFAMRAFTEFCAGAGVERSAVQSLELGALDDVLCKFYTGVKTKGGESYSMNSLAAMRFGLQKHYLETRNVDIVKDDAFSQSVKTYKFVKKCIRQNARRKALVPVPAITNSDMKLILNSINFNTASGLQQKVFLDLSVYLGMGRGSRSKMWGLKRDDFIVGVSERDGQRCVRLKDEALKIFQSWVRRGGVDNRSRSGQADVMFELRGVPGCPVASFLTYMQKLDHSCVYFWQRPLRCVSMANRCWYASARLGFNSLCDMMKTISSKARCSRTYSNQCLDKVSVMDMDHILRNSSATFSHVIHNNMAAKVTTANAVPRPTTARFTSGTTRPSLVFLAASVGGQVPLMQPQPQQHSQSQLLQRRRSADVGVQVDIPDKAGVSSCRQPQDGSGNRGMARQGQFAVIVKQEPDEISEGIKVCHSTPSVGIVIKQEESTGRGDNANTRQDPQTRSGNSAVSPDMWQSQDQPCDSGPSGACPEAGSEQLVAQGAKHDTQRAEDKSDDGWIADDTNCSPPKHKNTPESCQTTHDGSVHFVSSPPSPPHLEPKGPRIREPYVKCPLCDKTFSNKAYLRAHLPYHLGKQPFRRRCDKCCRALSVKRSKQKEKKKKKKRRLVHSAGFHFKCGFCKKKFWSKMTITSHP